MTTSVIGILTLLVAGCASQPPTKTTAMDPSSPRAAEAPVPALTPLVGADAARPTSTPAPEEPSAMPAGHHHGSQGGPGATSVEDTTAAPMEMPATSYQHEGGAGTEKAAVTYKCPMHPEISMPKPGKCPKCGMTLVPRIPTAALGEQPTEVPMAAPTHHHPTPNAEKSAVSYTCSMHPEVNSPKPGKCPKCGMKLIPRKPSEQK